MLKYVKSRNQPISRTRVRQIRQAPEMDFERGLQRSHFDSLGLRLNAYPPVPASPIAPQPQPDTSPAAKIQPIHTARSGNALLPHGLLQPAPFDIFDRPAPPMGHRRLVEQPEIRARLGQSHFRKIRHRLRLPLIVLHTPGDEPKAASRAYRKRKQTQNRLRTACRMDCHA